MNIPKLNQEFGPQTDTVNDEKGERQALFFAELQQYQLTDELAGNCDFFKVAEIDGILYYLPNDETWGGVIAIDNAAKLAIDTSFYEMDDMEYPDSDYKIVNHKGKLGCKFTFEKF